MLCTSWTHRKPILTGRQTNQNDGVSLRNHGGRSVTNVSGRNLPMHPPPSSYLSRADRPSWGCRDRFEHDDVGLSPVCDGGQTGACLDRSDNPRRARFSVAASNGVDRRTGRQRSQAIPLIDTKRIRRREFAGQRRDNFERKREHASISVLPFSTFGRPYEML